MAMLLLSAILFFALGIWQLTIPLDVLWQRRKRYFLYIGLSPQRNALWERQARSTGWVFIGLGIIFLLLFGVINSIHEQQMSGITINNHQLTQAEWDACEHDMPTCLTQEMMKRH